MAPEEKIVFVDPATFSAVIRDVSYQPSLGFRVWFRMGKPYYETSVSSGSSIKTVV